MSIKPILYIILINQLKRRCSQQKNNSGYDSFFPYNDNLVSPIPHMELANNSTTPIITPEEPNSVTPNLTNSPVNPNATVTGSNKNTNIETISPCKCRSAILNINSSKNDILKVEAQLSALKSYVNCNLSILRNLWWPIVIMLIFIHKRYF